MLGPVALPFEYTTSVDEAALIIAPGLSLDVAGAKALTGTVAGLRIELDQYLEGAR